MTRWMTRAKRAAVTTLIKTVAELKHQFLQQFLPGAAVVTTLIKTVAELKLLSGLIDNGVHVWLPR